MSNNTLISIVVLNYNGLEYLKKTIPSFLQQKYSNYEIIIVDNGSVDKSVEFIKKFEGIVLIENHSNLGYNQGKNIGVKASKGEFVLLLDEDIEIISDNFIESILNYYKKLSSENKRIGFLAPLLTDFGREKTKYYGIYYSIFGKRINKIIKIDNILKNKENIEIGTFHGGATFFNKKVWDELGGYDNDYTFGMDDYDIGARAYIFGYTNYLFKNKLIHLGKSKDENKKHFAKKFSFYYEGIATMVLKNFNTANLLKFAIIFLPYIFILNTLLIINKRNLYLIGAPIKGIFNLFSKMKILKIKRRYNQSKRTVKEDIFLKIRSPKFN